VSYGCTPRLTSAHVSDVTVQSGRAVAQSVSRRLPTQAARVRVRVKLCGICGGQQHWGRLSPVTSFSLPLVDSEGVRGSVVVKALCYKPEGRGFEIR
jgi:hypothetical protein